MADIAQHGPVAAAAAKSGTAFLAYMKSTWMPESLWQGWSQKGRVVAATLLKIPIEGVLPTTNHLESFNCLLKRKYIPRWQRAGARLRFDFLICILATRVLPEIFTLRRSQASYDAWLSTRFDVLQHGQRAVDNNRATTTRLYWCSNDAKRDEGATAIVHLRRIYNIQCLNIDIVEAMCAASSASLHDVHHSRYMLSMHRAGFANCSCLDFTSNGGACKHLRALRVIVDGWVAQSFLPVFYHPTSLDDARRVLSNLTPGPEPDPNVPHATIQHTTSLLSNIVALRQVAVKESGSDALSDISSIADSCDATDDNSSQASEDLNAALTVSSPKFWTS